MENRLNVYKIMPNNHYSGIALVAAHDAAEANSFIEAFKQSDPNNTSDSFGYCYVNRTDVIDDLCYAGEPGIFHAHIYYTG